ncbi:MAG: sigma-70 family RNA polymerase sigma factor [Pseudomonadota bacterium]
MSGALPCTCERTRQMESLVPVLRAVARAIVRRLPASVQLDDLVAAGAIGLIQAVDSFDPMRGASLETYARARIRGAILDELRRSDIVPRRLRDKMNRIARERARIVHEGGEDTDEAIAAAVGCTPVEVHDLDATVAGSGVLAFVDFEVVASPLPGAEHVLGRRQLEQALRQAVAQLPDREKQVLSLYYDRQLTYQQIGQIFGVTESRVCQIHRAATRRLRVMLSTWENERPTPVDTGHRTADAGISVLNRPG